MVAGLAGHYAGAAVRWLCYCGSCDMGYGLVFVCYVFPLWATAWAWYYDDSAVVIGAVLGLPETNDVARSDRDVLMIRDKSSQVQNHPSSSKERTDRLGTFFEGLCKYARYSRFEVFGSLRNTDFLNSAIVICSLSFDQDEECFAAAGVSKKIKIFEYNSLLNDNVDIHYPLIEMSSKSKLRCVCWNGYIKNYLASTDYDGAVQLWDASSGQGFTQFREHQKRACSVDFSPTDPMKLVAEVMIV